jgi:starvation-inducible DNA-binding protein
MKPNIGISEKNLKGASEILSSLLANEMVLYVKTRKAHWNVSGHNFMELHKLYEEQYKQLEETTDLIAERIGKLGHPTIGTMQEYCKMAGIKENPGEYASTKDTLKELLNNHETVISQLREDIGLCSEKFKDAGTTDFLTYVLESHETIAWILRRYLD